MIKNIRFTMQLNFEKAHYPLYTFLNESHNLKNAIRIAFHFFEANLENI